MDVAATFGLALALFCPIVIVAFGGMFSERSGVINLGLEGIMLFSAMFGCLVLQGFNIKEGGVDKCIAPGTEQLIVLLAILVAMGSGILFSFLLSFASIKLKANQTITGTALNLLAPAFGMIFIAAIQSSTNTTIVIPTWAKLGASLADQNAFNRFLFSNMFLTTPVIILLLIASSVFLYKTKIGLRLRACGENPQAADSVGVKVNRMRYLGVSISGALGGIGGLAYVMATSVGFQADVGTAGYGFLALAVMIFGNWKPLGIVLAGATFVILRVFVVNLPSIPGVNEINQLYLCIPYIVTLLTLVIFSKRNRAPKAEGIPYDKSIRS